jgi:hypothetical protein
MRVGSAAAGIALVALPILAAAPASAAVSGQQWSTSETGTFFATDVFMTYGTSGVTVHTTGSKTPNTGGCILRANVAGGSLGAQSNASGLFTPAPPTGSQSITVDCAPNSDLTATVTASKPLLAPILHVAALDSTSVTVGGSSTASQPIHLSALSGNAAFTPSGDTINPTPATTESSATGCSASTGVEACGSARLTTSSGAISAFTMEEVSGASADPGWYWTVSYPTVALTPSFASAISPGGVTQLTYSIPNPNVDGGSSALDGLDFTNALPSGVTIADSTVSDNGSCGAPTLTPTAGDSSVTAGAISVPLGATCTISVDVTAASSGVYTDDPTATTSSVANLVPDGSGALTVSSDSQLSIAGTTLPDASTATAYSQQLTAGGGSGTVTWAVVGGSLPDGLSLDPSTGLITGTATTPGTSDFSVQATDSDGQVVSQPESITVDAPVVGAPLGTVTPALIALAVCLLAAGVIAVRRRSSTQH